MNDISLSELVYVIRHRNRTPVRILFGTQCFLLTFLHLDLCQEYCVVLCVSIKAINYIPNATDSEANSAHTHANGSGLE